MAADAINTNNNNPDIGIIASSKINSRATDRGTTIVKPGEEMDKNAFLRILSAELSNQDPTNAKDSTEYVSQMAQFTNLEQMANLNNNLNFTGASSLIGKTVKLNQKDSFGNQFGGVVKGVIKESGQVKLNIDIEENGKVTTKAFPIENVVTVE